MKEDKAKTQQDNRCWVGLDWGGEAHAVSVVDDTRKVVETFKVGASLADLEQLGQRLRKLGTVAGVAIEATHKPVVIYLMSAGFTIYPINPKMSKSWRECNSVASIKNDERDGLVLAMELARRHESLRTLKQQEPSVAELAGLCEKLRALIDERTALVQRLEEILGQYHPCALGFFSEWTSPAAWRFVKRFPRPESLAHARKDTLIRFLRANRIGLRPIWLERIEARGEAERWPHPADSAALEIMALALVGQLLALQPYIDKCDRLIAERMRDFSETPVLESLPGAGERLAPALTAITAVAASEGEGVEGLRCLSGVGPAEDKSCKRQRVRIRRRCNKHWRNIMHLFAWCSTNSCAWARAFYDIHREQGDTHAGALRKLADKWLKIINRMLKTGEAYDDQRYVDALRKNGSPVYARLCGKACG